MVDCSNETRIQLCGRLVVKLRGERLEAALPGRQGRLLFAYLASNRHRPLGRPELTEALWPQGAPAAAETALGALLSKLRAVLSPEAITGKGAMELLLPEGAWIDLEAAPEALHRAQSAIALEDWSRAWGPSRVALHVTTREFLSGYEAPWIDEHRRQLEGIRFQALECVAASGLGLGGPELAATERSARALIEAAPFRESGYRLLMEALDRRGNVAEALVVYDQLRRLLSEELGIAPGEATQEIYKRLLTGEAGDVRSARGTSRPF